MCSYIWLSSKPTEKFPSNLKSRLGCISSVLIFQTLWYRPTSAKNVHVQSDLWQFFWFWYRSAGIFLGSSLLFNTECRSVPTACLCEGFSVLFVIEYHVTHPWGLCCHTWNSGLSLNWSSAPSLSDGISIKYSHLLSTWACLSHPQTINYFLWEMLVKWWASILKFGVGKILMFLK